MITINLLPTQRKKSLAPQPNQAMLMLLAGVLAVGSLAVAYYYHYALSARRALKDKLVSQQKAYETEVAEAKDLQAKLDALQKRKQLIVELLFSGPEVARKLNQISDLVPARIWLEEVRLDTENRQEQRVVQQGENRTTKTVTVEITMLSITGVTEDLTNGPSLVADFIGRLQNSPFMKDILGEIEPRNQAEEAWLANSSTPGGNRPVWRFRVSMQVNPDARKAKVKEKENPDKNKLAGSAVAAGRS